jgi:hypothetical protein
MELLVVLLLIGLAAAVVAPAIRAPTTLRRPLGQVVLAAREAAARRGELIYLRIDPSGQWRIEGAASAPQHVIAAGRIAPVRGLPMALILSPIGTCAADVRTAASGTAVTLDPLTCEVDAP